MNMFMTFSILAILDVLTGLIVFLAGLNKDEDFFKENWKLYLGFFFLFITIGAFCLILGIGAVSI